MQAKFQDGQWLVRMDDIDTPRNQAGADTAILKSLEILGLHWDNEVLFQTNRQQAYQDALKLLSEKSLLYRCTCTRKQLQGNAYPGTCRNKGHGSEQQHFQQNLETEIGDFIVYRADDLVAYHIATVVDDAFQGITEIVRGADLLDSTPRQIYLQQLFNYPTPTYAHLPVAVDKQGYKLSKQYHAPPVDDKDPVTTLILALDFLGQHPEKSLAKESVEEVIQWGVKHWSLDKIPRLDTIEVEST
jgi:glutamyl-Q tRNA(Asp) synthetase